MDSSLHFFSLTVPALSLAVLRSSILLSRIKRSISEGPKYEVDGDLKVSVIVPTWNEEKYLPKLLESLKRQSYKNIEVIVADYCSTDRTVDIARAYGARVVLVSKRGIGYACAVAGRHARGEVILRTDADVILPPHIIEHSLEQLKQYDVVYTPFLFYDGDPLVNAAAYIYAYIRPRWMTCGRYTMIRRETYESIGGFDETKDVYEDIDIGLKVKKFYGEDRILHMVNDEDWVLTSSRRVYANGIIHYALGIDLRIGFPPRR